MSLKFGTDGVRGVANVDLTPELVVALGRAAARVLPGDRFVVGRDTRLSGPSLQAALTAGLTAEGVDVADAGVVPTPAIARICAIDGVPGAVISASHNRFQDNGIKFFAAGGVKLPDDVEDRLEAELASPSSPPPRQGSDVGRVERYDGEDVYRRSLVDSLQGRRLEGLRLVLDCANGAASHVAPTVFRELGADVTTIGDAPDGTNINEGFGSTHPDRLQQAVVQQAADAGLAFDGDADRVLAVDHRGHLVDGDQIVAMCALDRRDRGALPRDTVVVTVMTNLGFRHAMQREGVALVETKVGDRYVLEALDSHGLSLGGEQSGHIIFRDLATTGDGLLTGLQIGDLMVRTGRPLAELASVVTRLPQVLVNVHVANRDAVDGAEVAAAVKEVEAQLGDNGRVLLRPSGTEPVIRVMVEAPTHAEADDAAARLVRAVERAAN